MVITDLVLLAYLSLPIPICIWILALNKEVQAKELRTRVETHIRMAKGYRK